MEKKQQLSPEEIEKLFEFVRSKNVPYKDVQFEIVDHLASAIEDIQRVNPELAFDDAISNVYAKFPITGFATLQIEKEKFINLYWRKKFGFFMLQFFRIPRIILTITLFILFYNLLIRFGLLALSLLCFLCFLYMVYASRQKKWFKEYMENYMMIKSFRSSILFFFNIVLWVLYFYWILLFDHLKDLSPTSLNILFWISALFLSLAFIFTYASYKIFPDMLKEEINYKYRHLQLNVA